MLQADGRSVYCCPNLPSAVVQLPPWQASEAALAAYEARVHDGVWPAELAATLDASGSVRVPYNAVLMRCDLDRLLPDVWLNDELINYAMWLYQQRDARLQGLSTPFAASQWTGLPGVSCHFFNSFFMAKLFLDGLTAGTLSPGSINYSAVRRWTTAGKLKIAGQARFKAGVLSCELLIAPCNIDGSHWVLVVADLQRRRILYLDSAGVSMSRLQDHPRPYFLHTYHRACLMCWHNTHCICAQHCW